MLTVELKVDFHGLGKEINTVAILHIVNMGAPLKGDMDFQKRIYHAWLGETGEPPDHSRKPDAVVSHYRSDGALMLLQKVISAVRKTPCSANSEELR